MNRQPVEVERTDNTDDNADDYSDDNSKVFFVTTKKAKPVPRHTTQAPDISLDRSCNYYEDKRSRVCKPRRTLLIVARRKVLPHLKIA